jgi:hypothetical protein
MQLSFGSQIEEKHVNLREIIEKTLVIMTITSNRVANEKERRTSNLMIEELEGKEKHPNPSYINRLL